MHYMFCLRGSTFLVAYRFSLSIKYLLATTIEFNFPSLCFCPNVAPIPVWLAFVEVTFPRLFEYHVIYGSSVILFFELKNWLKFSPLQFRSVSLLKNHVTRPFVPVGFIQVLKSIEPLWGKNIPLLVLWMAPFLQSIPFPQYLIFIVFWIVLTHQNCSFRRIFVFWQVTLSLSSSNFLKNLSMFCFYSSFVTGVTKMISSNKTGSLNLTSVHLFLEILRVFWLIRKLLF